MGEKYQPKIQIINSQTLGTFDFDIYLKSGPVPYLCGAFIVNSNQNIAQSHMVSGFTSNISNLIGRQRVNLR